MKCFVDEEPKEGAFFAVYSDLSGATFFYKDDTGIFRDPVNDREIDDVNWFLDALYLWFFEVDDRFIELAEGLIIKQRPKMTLEQIKKAKHEAIRKSWERVWDQFSTERQEYALKHSGWIQLHHSENSHKNSAKNRKLHDLIFSRYDEWSELDLEDGYLYLDREYDVYHIDDIVLVKKDYEIGSIRPVSLSGIEDNNGWIKINSEDDLPKEDGYCWVIDDSRAIWPAWYNASEHEFEEAPEHWSRYTHYKPIPDPDKPLF